MPAPSSHHPNTPKAKYKVNNWREYNQALVNRGSITFWLDETVLAEWWDKEPNGKKGRDTTYSDLAIQTFLMVQAVYGLSLRKTEGFLNSLFKLMNVDLNSPDYSCVSKRAKLLNVKLPKQTKNIAHLVIDATGLKIYGEGEWKVCKHGAEKRRCWRKLHLGVDANSQQIISAEMSMDGIGDNEVLPDLLRTLKGKIGKVSGDGAYDTHECYQEVKQAGGQANFPPRSNAILWPNDHPRNQAVSALHEGRIKQWKQETNYHQRSLVETAMWRYKSQTGEKLRSRDYNAQVSEALARVAVLNKMTSLGMPESQMVR